MAFRVIGQGLPRNEDERLLKGAGLFVDDVRLPGMCHAALLRSPYAHARIRAVDTAAARALPGVRLVWTWADLPDGIKTPLPLLIPHPALTAPRTHLALARDVVRYVGEPVALVVADDRYIAEDALELIQVDYEPLPVVSDLRRAASDPSERVHEDLPDNVAAHLVQGFGDVDDAFRRAAVVVRETIHPDRGTASSIETRGVAAYVDPNGMLTVWDSTQAPIPIRNGLARLLNRPEERVRVIAPDVGGAFGAKIMMFYPEEVLVPAAALALSAPVKWIEDRRENFMATTQEREQWHDIAVACDRDGRILAVRDTFLHDTGAYCPYGIIVPIVTATTLMGPYRIPAYLSDCRVVYTNRPMVTPYRGAGRPHAVFVMERMIERIAERLGLDSAEVRRRNFIPPDAFPYRFDLIYQDGAPVIYDSGDYGRALDLVLETIDVAAFRREQEEARKAGRHLGLGIACYVEGSGVGPYEGARVRVEPDGTVTVATGVGTQGQSHYTTLAQVVAEQLGVRVEDVRVTTGDTQAFGWGIGTFASRAAVTAGNACHLAALSVREKALRVAARLLEAAEDDLELVDGMVRVRGVPARAVPLGEVAVAANPLRGTLPPGFEPGLEATKYFTPPQATFPYGVHGLVIEVEPRTERISIRRYVVVHDCGTLLNPTVVEGQIHGGVAQGLGGAYYEKLVFDEQGQLLTTSYMDYLLPTASEIPPIEVLHLETPSPLNPLGVKGAGEAGVIAVGAAFAAAVEDALHPFGVRVTEMPLSPDHLFRLIREARGGAEGAPA
jgi:carbon-monoxide dehydrogenase large subunit